MEDLVNLPAGAFQAVIRSTAAMTESRAGCPGHKGVDSTLTGDFTIKPPPPVKPSNLPTTISPRS